MLALLRPRCLPHSPRLLQTRGLRASPRRIPSYLKRRFWHEDFIKSEKATEAKFVLDLDKGQLQHKEQLYVPTDSKDVRQRRLIENLNSFLGKASLGTDNAEALHHELWNAYQQAKHVDPKLNLRLPDQAWDILWSSQWTYLPDSENHNLVDRLAELAYDMEGALQLGPAIRIPKTFEDLFFGGEQEKALSLWEEDYGRCGEHGQEYEAEHLEVGARLHALAGNARRARDIMEQLYMLFPSWDTSVMVDVFRAHTSSDNKEQHAIAKDIYDAMKERKADKITIQDYDAWLMGFIKMKHLRYAEAVFRDLVHDGHVSLTESVEDIAAVLKRFHMLEQLGMDVHSKTNLALDALAVLPRSYHFYLFSDWMKTAVAENAPQVTVQIMDIMLQRGYTPETTHLNLLLKSLFRSKNDPSVLKAENIGWGMIDEACKARTCPIATSVPDQIYWHATHPTDLMEYKNSDGKLAVANTTTVALMMHHHGKKLQWEHVDYLMRQFKEQNMKPNETILNVMLDNSCRKGSYAEVWATYQSFTNPTSEADAVFPTGSSMRQLWKTLRLALGDHETRDDPKLPNPRELLKETVKWWRKCKFRPDAARFHMGLTGRDKGALTKLVMHCFSYTQDLAGSLVAIHVLRWEFNILPTEEMETILKRQVGFVDMTLENKTVRAGFKRSNASGSNAKRVARVYELLKTRREEEMAKQGLRWDMMSAEQRGDLRLQVMSDFVRVKLGEEYSPELVEKMISVAAWSVGVYGLHTGFAEDVQPEEEPSVEEKHEESEKGGDWTFHWDRD